MSFSFRLPEEDPICECRYDEIRDRMDREDCPFHCDLVDDTELAGVQQAGRKPLAAMGVVHSEGQVRSRIGRATTGLFRLY
jgi:hypothetical protein